MPDQHYIKYPRIESIRYFEQAMKNHDSVSRCEKISDSYYKIQRKNMSSIYVFVSNFYALSISDYMEIASDYYIDCLITISNWNSVTDDAYKIGKENGVGVFTMSEFMGALNFEKPCDYVRPIDRDDNDRDRFVP